MSKTGSGVRKIAPAPLADAALQQPRSIGGDGLRRKGNVPATSQLRSDSQLVRYTVAGSIALTGALRLKLSGEYYDFSDFDDESVIHVGIAGPF